MGSTGFASPEGTAMLALLATYVASMLALVATVLWSTVTLTAVCPT